MHTCLCLLYNAYILVLITQQLLIVLKHAYMGFNLPTTPDSAQACLYGLMTPDND